MKKTTLIFLLFGSFLLRAQSPTDPKDAQGRPNGVWQKLHANGKIRYTGTFNHGTPVDTFKYYYESGQLKTENVFRGKSGICMSFQYGEKKILAAKGLYNKRQKDSVWTYFNRAGDVVSRVSYKNGLEEGLTEKYHTNGKLAESVSFKEGKENGPWLQFYESGKKMAQGQYVNGKLQGETTYFFSSGRPRSRGNHVKGLMDGTWFFFTDDLKLDHKEIWKRGRLVDDGSEKEEKAN